LDLIEQTIHFKGL